MSKYILKTSKGRVVASDLTIVEETADYVELKGDVVGFDGALTQGLKFWKNDGSIQRACFHTAMPWNKHYGYPHMKKTKLFLM